MMSFVCKAANEEKPSKLKIVELHVVSAFAKHASGRI